MLFIFYIFVSINLYVSGNKIYTPINYEAFGLMQNENRVSNLSTL